jgi:hypothetical protein
MPPGVQCIPRRDPRLDDPLVALAYMHDTMSSLVRFRPRVPCRNCGA